MTDSAEPRVWTIDTTELVELSAYQSLVESLRLAKQQRDQFECERDEFLLNCEQSEKQFHTLIKERDELRAKLERANAELDKLHRLLAGEEVELECKSPGYSATIKLDDDKAIVTERWDKKHSESAGEEK